SAGLEALFGAPVAHEDDPERAVRAAYRVQSDRGCVNGEMTIRIGVETGPAVVGPTALGYAAVGEVSGTAALLASVAMEGSVLVGPATRAAVEAVFDWGPEEEATRRASKPVVASYLERPRARPGAPGRHLAWAAPLVGRAPELAVLDVALKGAVSGAGGVVLVVGEPGLGKTRLVSECRKRYMAWVGAGTGRLPLWLEGRAAS
ncbi:MAG TPA: AAA family ATPase, partial [bacterium]|nr:AAA family ATPase [bacterium]